MSKIETKENLLIFEILDRIRFVIFVSIASSIIYFYPDQIKEVYIYNIESGLVKLGFLETMFPVIILSISLSIAATYVLVSDYSGEFPLKTKFIIYIVATAPLVTFVVGVVYAYFELMIFSSGPKLELITNTKILYGFIFLFIFHASFIYFIMTYWPKSIISLIYPYMLVILSVFTLAFSIVISYVPLETGKIFGVILLVSLFFCILVLFGCALTKLYDKTKKPFLSLLILAGFSFSILGCNDNHLVRTQNQKNNFVGQDYRLSFLSWLASRENLNDAIVNKRDYPIVIIAAEGGGAYAAYHTAKTLAKIQDSCPAFAQHVFGVSGVSGGSLGAAVFSSIAKNMAKNQSQLPCRKELTNKGHFQNITEKFFENDFLSPLIAAGIFPDFLQRFLFWPIYDFSRATALEKSWERAWTIATNGDQAFKENFVDLWNPRGATPALILNSTMVTLGRRELIAPFKINLSLAPQSLQHIGTKVNLPMSTAVSLSARFPWVTPVGHISTDSGNLYLADGGYFENSGSETAHNMIHDLKQFLRNIKTSGLKNPWFKQFEATSPLKAELISKYLMHAEPRFILFVIRATRPAPSKRAWRELGSPLQALLNTRIDRGTLSLRHAVRSLCPMCSIKKISKDDRIWMKVLNVRKLQLPLGWLISKHRRLQIDSTLLPNDKCPLDQQQHSKESVILRNSVNTNLCLYSLIKANIDS